MQAIKPPLSARNSGEICNAHMCNNVYRFDEAVPAFNGENNVSMYNTG